MDPVGSVTSRIAAIQSRFAMLSPQQASGYALGAAPLASASADATFAAAYTRASELSPTLTPVTVGGVEPGSGKALLNANGVPMEYLAYGNGRIPDHALSEISGGNGHQLWAPAARSFEALREAAARDGVTIGITDSYRDYDTQADLVKRKGLYSQGGLAAPAGTSNHGWGTALDLRLDANAQQWMRENAGRFGFVEDVPREPWHWHYVPTS